MCVLCSQGYGDVVSDLSNSRTPFTSKDHVDFSESNRRVVLLSSKSRGSDWDLTTANSTATTIDGQESEDSGFQIEVDSTINKTASTTTTTEMIVTTNKVYL